MEVRTRFAPSPTGYMHLGNLRTALYTYLYARSKGGKFILRIEATDQEREVPGAVEVIYNSMKTAGLTHDEGPDVGGPVGPYIQSQRKDTYMPYAKQLVESGPTTASAPRSGWRRPGPRPRRRARTSSTTSTACICPGKRFRRSWTPACPSSSARISPPRARQALTT